MGRCLDSVVKKLKENPESTRREVLARSIFLVRAVCSSHVGTCRVCREQGFVRETNVPQIVSFTRMEICSAWQKRISCSRYMIKAQNRKCGSFQALKKMLRRVSIFWRAIKIKLSCFHTQKSLQKMYNVFWIQTFYLSFSPWCCKNLHLGIQSLK